MTDTLRDEKNEMGEISVRDVFIAHVVDEVWFGHLKMFIVMSGDGNVWNFTIPAL